MKKIALLSSVLANNPFPSFYFKLQKIACKKFATQIDLLHNGEFQYFLNKNSSKIFYQDKPFEIEQYSLLFSRLAIKASHTGDYYVAMAFENATIPTINATANITICRNKMHTLQIVQTQKIAVVPTVVVRTRENIENAVNILASPSYIVKSCFGSGGKNVLLAHTVHQLIAIFDYLWDIDRNEVLLIQPFVVTKPTCDIRVLCIGYEPKYAIRRIAKKGEFRSNVKMGAKCTAIELSQKEKTMCCKIARILKLPLAGIDFLQTDHGPLLLEVNATPGIEGIITAYSKKKMDVVYDLAEFLCTYENK